MDNLNFKKLYSPIITQQNFNKQKVSVSTDKIQTNFSEVFKQKINSDISFSKHATERIIDRGIDIGEMGISKLNEALEIAKKKGIDQTLVIMEKNAFIISAKNNKVITGISENDLKNNVITNIQGAVIV